jgi:hypothetical protein
MARHSSVEDARMFFEAVKKHIGSSEKSAVAKALGISVPTLYLWLAHGIPLRKLEKFNEKLTGSGKIIDSGLRIRPKPDEPDPKMRIWVSVICTKCRSTYEIGCRTFQSHDLPESPTCHLSFGTFICPKCTSTSLVG